MRKVRHRKDRGKADHGWLKTAHTFSFANDHDDAHMRFRHLRVINEDFVAPQTGFGKHGHRDMESLTYVTAGTGIRHSERDNTEDGCTYCRFGLYPRSMGSS